MKTPGVGKEDGTSGDEENKKYFCERGHKSASYLRKIGEKGNDLISALKTRTL